MEVTAGVGCCFCVAGYGEAEDTKLLVRQRSRSNPLIQRGAGARGDPSWGPVNNFVGGGRVNSG